MKLELFTLENCPPCVKLKQDLEAQGLLDRFRIYFFYRNPEKNNREDSKVLNRYGIRSFPTIVVDEKIMPRDYLLELIELLNKEK